MKPIMWKIIAGILRPAVDAWNVYIKGNLEVDGTVQLDGGVTLDGSVIIEETSTEALLVRKEADGGDLIAFNTTSNIILHTGDHNAANAAGPAILNEAASATNPTLVPNKADPDTGMGSNAADDLSLIAGGTEVVRLEPTLITISTDIDAADASGPSILNEAASATNPTLIPLKGTDTAGIGAQAAGNVSIIANSLEQLRVSDGALLLVKAGASLSGSDAASGAILNEAAGGTNPTLVPNKADDDTGIGWNSSNNLALIAGGAPVARIVSSGIQIGNNDRAAMVNIDASVTAPVFIISQADTNTGIGGNRDDQVSLIAGGNEVLRLSENTVNDIAFKGASAAIGGSRNWKVAYGTTGVIPAGPSATLTITMNVPVRSVIRGISVRNTVAVTLEGAGTTYDAKLDGGSATVLTRDSDNATEFLLAKNTKADMIMVGEKVTATTNLLLTPDAGLGFTGGTIDAIIYYEDLSSMASVA